MDLSFLIFIFVLFAIAIAALRGLRYWLKWRASVHEPTTLPTGPGECPRCGYDLTGIKSLQCPECGYVVPKRKPPNPTEEQDQRLAEARKKVSEAYEKRRKQP